MKNSKSNGISLTGVLFLIFLILKLTGNIDWSWWWVTSPLWIPLLLVLAVISIGICVITTLLLLGFSASDIKAKFKIKDKQEEKGSI